MKRPLIKLYLSLAISLALTIVFLPMIVGRTSAWAQTTVTQAELLVYQSTPDAGMSVPEADMGRVVFVMDDGWETQYTSGYRILKEFGMKGCIAVVPAMVGEAAYVDYEQLAEVYMDGWDLLNHTYNHANLTSLSAEDQAEQITKGRDWLYDHLFTRGADIVVYPQGKFTDETIKILRQNGFAAARSLNSLWTAEHDCIVEDAEICNLISSISMEKVEAAVNKAVSNSSTVIFVLHKIESVTDDSQMQLDEDMFREIVAYIAGNEDKLNVLTMTELLELEV